MPPVMPLPPPPAAAASQWAQHAYTASVQAAAAKAAAAKAAEVASAQAAAAQAAATQAQVAQVSAQQAAAAQVAQSLGYNVAPVGVPSAAAYGDTPGGGPPYGAAPGAPRLLGIDPLAMAATALFTQLAVRARPRMSLEELPLKQLGPSCLASARACGHSDDAGARGGGRLRCRRWHRGRCDGEQFLVSVQTGDLFPRDAVVNAVAGFEPRVDILSAGMYTNAESAVAAAATAADAAATL